MCNRRTDRCCYKRQRGLLYNCKIIRKIVIDYVSYSLYEVVINCLLFEFTINGRTCNTQLLYDTRDGNTAVFDGFLQDFALMWHI